MDNISLYLTSACLGVIIFFSIILAPTVFKVLSKDFASRYLRAFFPKFYLFLFGLTGLAAILSNEAIITSMLSVTSVLFLLSRWPLTTAINNASDEKNTKKFKFLHGFSVSIIMFQIAIMFSLFFIST
tara:strand:- start:99 stop:482 length:384 start_codon:yes stop_codon:yes gene_type:complete